MDFLIGTEKANSIWGRLLLAVMFGAYIIACVVHESAMPIVGGFMILVASALFYYMPLRLFYWLFTGSGDIKHGFLLWPPFIFMTLLGIALIFSEMP